MLTAFAFKFARFVPEALQHFQSLSRLTVCWWGKIGMPLLRRRILADCVAKLFWVLERRTFDWVHADQKLSISVGREIERRVLQHNRHEGDVRARRSMRRDAFKPFYIR